MKISLFIDTSHPGRMTVVLDEGDRFFSHSFSVSLTRKKSLLKEIDRQLKKHGYTCQDLGGIGVVVGPGPFTTLRNAVVIANTLGYSLKIRTVGIRGDEFSTIDEGVRKMRKKLSQSKYSRLLEPFYGQEPHITLPRRKRRF